jgi:hypothetical protein
MQKQKGISTLAGLIIIIVAVIILFGGVFAYQYFGTSAQPQQSVNLANNYADSLGGHNNQAGPDGGAITVGWKTYTVYGISFKYPNDWGQPSVMQGGANLTISLNGNNVVFNIKSYYNNSTEKNETFEEVVNGAISSAKANGASVSGRSNIVVDGRNGVQVSYYTPTSGGGYTDVYVPIDSESFLTAEFGRWYGDYIGKIIPTVKFTK